MQCSAKQLIGLPGQGESSFRKFHSARGAVSLPFGNVQDASFDLVTCQYGLQFTPDVTKAMAEAARVLRPGGMYVAAVNVGKSDMDQARGLIMMTPTGRCAVLRWR